MMMRAFSERAASASTLRRRSPVARGWTVRKAHASINSMLTTKALYIHTLAYFASDEVEVRLQAKVEVLIGDSTCAR